MITKTAWKNIWRNKTRSIVVIASVTIGVFSGVFAIGVMEGMMGQRVDEALNNEVSHIQITQSDFRANNDLIHYIENADNSARQISEIEGVEALCSRIVLMGMANSASGSQGVQINGIYPDQERSVFNLHNKVYPGSGGYFSDEKGRGYAYIGVDLAKSLGIIRYIISDEALAAIKEDGVPADVREKLEQFKGTRFRNEKIFKKRLAEALGDSYFKNHGKTIGEAAWSFSERARLTITFLDKDNYQTGARFRIAGLYDIPNSIYEKMQVFVMADELRDLAGLPEDIAHQQIVKISSKDESALIADKISSLFPEREVLTWQKIQPELAMMSELTFAMYGFFMVIILAALAFGIVNTMLMVVLERTRELGMLSAIGMNKKKVFRMIMTESVLLSFTGGIIGLTLSYLLISITGQSGLTVANMQEGFEEMGFSVHIYPSIGPDMLLMVTVLIILTGIVSSIYPAVKALKLDPAEALRTE